MSDIGPSDWRTGTVLEERGPLDYPSVEPDASEPDEDARAESIVRRIQAGEDGAFAQLYEIYFQPICKFVRIGLDDPSTVQDVAQETFTRALEALPSLARRPGSPIRNWLFGIARNAMIDELRRRSRLVPCDPEQLDSMREGEDPAAPGEHTLGWIADDRVVASVRGLPETQRRVVLMRYLLDLSTAEIAQKMDKTEKAVRQLHLRAMKTLENKLDASGYTSSRVQRAPTLIRLRGLPVLAGRRFALLGSALPFSRR